MSKYYEIEEQKRRFKAELKKAEAVFAKAKAKWKKAWAEKSDDRWETYKSVTEAGDDMAFWDFQVRMAQR